MSGRQYSIGEIDRMRAAVLKKRMPKRQPDFDGATWHSGQKSPMEKSEDHLRAIRAACEEELRTYLIAGISPEEVEASVTDSSK